MHTYTIHRDHRDPVTIYGNDYTIADTGHLLIWERGEHEPRAVFPIGSWDYLTIDQDNQRHVGHGYVKIIPTLGGETPVVGTAYVKVEEADKAVDTSEPPTHQSGPTITVKPGRSYEVIDEFLNALTTKPTRRSQ